ncbi:MAG: histidine phosphatase family protein [Proteobacteria bacterium]|nr:histidine phosphatase family protein [Pseudomonadota bacterium]
MQESTLIVIRHGETEWNIQGRWQGHNDSPLTNNGIDQAKAAAQAVKSFKTSALYSSDLGRTIQTAESIVAETGHTILTDARLRERHLGIFQGLTIQQMSESYPSDYEHFKSGDAEYKVPEGESIRQRYNRSIECINELASNHPGESIIVVTHGGVLDGFFRYVTGLGLSAPRFYKIWNCGLNIFAKGSNGWALHTFGDVSHLRNLKTRDDE